MKKQKDTAVCATAHGKPIPGGPFNYDYEWDDYETTEEQQAANDMLSEKEQLKARNTERKNNSRAAQLALRLAELGIEKPTLKTDDQLKLKTVYNVFMSIEGTTHEEARQKAVEALNNQYQWAD